MAFKGGFLVKPTTTNTQNLANLLVQGTQAIEKKKMELDGIASDYMKETNKSVADIPVNGPAGFPVLMTKSGAVIRQAQMKAYQDYKDGKIGIDDYKIISSKLNSEATIISKSGELAAQRNEEINKGIADGNLSGINAVLNHGIFRAASGSSNNETNVIPSIDPFNNLILTQSFFRPEVDGSNTPVSKTSSVSERLAPASGFVPYKSVDLAADIKTFKSNLGSSGIVTTERRELEDGSFIDDVKIDQSNDPKVQSAIETAIDTYLNDEDSLVDIAHKFGMKVDLDPSYKPYSKERISSKFGNDPLFNASGETISISPEDMLLETSDNGIKVQLSDKQKDILAGHLRKQFYNSVGVTDQRFFMNRPSDTNKAATKINARSSSLSSSTRTINMLTNGGASSILEDIVREQNDTFQLLAGGVEGAEIPKPIKEFASTRVDGSDVQYQFESVSLSNELGEVILDTMNPISFTGQKLKSVTDIVVKLDQKNGKTDYKIVLLGPSDVGSKETRIGTSDDETAITSKVSESLESSMTLPQSEVSKQRLYQSLWDSNDDFRKIAEDNLLNRESKDYGLAFYTVFKAIKNR